MEDCAIPQEKDTGARAVVFWGMVGGGHEYYFGCVDSWMCPWEVLWEVHRQEDSCVSSSGKG